MDSVGSDDLFQDHDPEVAEAQLNNVFTSLFRKQTTMLTVKKKKKMCPFEQ